MGMVLPPSWHCRHATLLPSLLVAEGTTKVYACDSSYDTFVLRVAAVASTGTGFRDRSVHRQLSNSAEHATMT